MRKLFVTTSVFFVVLGIASVLHAKEAAPLAADPALEAQVQLISRDLRCLVCQNETIAASQSSLAIDLREQVRSQLKQGRSEQQIRDFMVERYGDFVLYRPPVKALTWLLWGGPFVLLLVAAVALRRTMASRSQQLAEAPALTADDAALAQRLLRREAL